jgi:hypothetical protein
MALVAAIPLVLWSFSVDQGGFVGSGDSDQWEWAVPTSGPGGTAPVWATQADGLYLNDSVDYLEAPLPDLSATADPVLTIRHWYDMRAGDEAVIEVFASGGWTPVLPIFGQLSAPFSGNSGGWVNHSFDLVGYPSATAIRLGFSADSTLAADGWYVAEMAVYDGDVTPPFVVPLNLPVDTEVVEQPYEVSLSVEDDTATNAVTVWWSADGGDVQQLALSDVGGDVWTGSIPAQAPDTDVAWYAVADDGAQTSRWPEAGEQAFRVGLLPPTDLGLVDDGRLIGTDISMTWAAPASIHTILSYVIEATDSVLAGPWVVFDEQGTVPLTLDGPRSFQVRAVYDVGIGDAAGPVEVSGEVPALTSVDPMAAWPGDRVRVGIDGHSLYLADGSTEFDFGSQVIVESIEVLSVDHADVLLHVAADAEPGSRTLTIFGSQGQFAFADSFLVLDGALAPAIVSVEPPSATQGDTVALTIRASAPFEGAVSLDPGNHVLLTSDPVVDGATLSVELVVSGNAAVGPHTLVVDDGRRLWTVDWTIDQRVYEVQTGCGAGCNVGSSGSGFASWIALFFLARRRQR